MLTVTAGIDDQPPRVYDDVVEAMTDVVEHDLKPWQPASGRRTALSAAGLLMALGAVAPADPARLHARRGGRRDRGRGAGRRGDRALARPGRGRGGGRGRLDGRGLRHRGRADAGSRRRLLRRPVGRRRAAARWRPGWSAWSGSAGAARWCIPPVVVGAVFLATGLLLRVGDFDAAVVLTVVLALVVMVGSIFPWLALGAHRHRRRPALLAPADITADPDEIDPDQVGADARLAHEILIAISGTVGLLLVLIAPLAVSLGVVRHVPGRGRVPGRDAADPAVPHRLRGAGRAGVRHPRPGLGRGLADGDAPRLAAGRRRDPGRDRCRAARRDAAARRRPSVRRGRLGDVVESLGLLALLPLLVLATGLFDAITS